MGRRRLVVAAVLVLGGAAGAPSLRSGVDVVAAVEESAAVADDAVNGTEAAGEGLFSSLRRVLFKNEGSRCITNGGGRVPYFNSCIGCPVGAAHACVNDMRMNVSFNVPQARCCVDQPYKVSSQACTLGGMHSSPDKNFACCARHRSPETFAYRDAIRCLQGVKCQKSDVMIKLLAECAIACPISDAAVWNLACTASTISAASTTRASPVVLLLAVIIMPLGLLLF